MPPDIGANIPTETQNKAFKLWLSISSRTILRSQPLVKCYSVQVIYARVQSKSLTGIFQNASSCFFGLKEIMRLLLEKGSDPGSKDGNGRTPL